MMKRDVGIWGYVVIALALIAAVALLWFLAPGTQPPRGEPQRPPAPSPAPGSPETPG
jgi:hypothetical protein